MTRGPTSPAHDLFEVAFQGLDLVASYWQPYFRGLGKWQLEMAQLGVKQVRSTMDFSQNLMRADHAAALPDLYRNYWTELADNAGEAARNIATAFVKAAPHAAVLQLPIESRRPSHDTLILVDEEPQRRVA